MTRPVLGRLTMSAAVVASLYAIASACQVPDLDERGKSCTSTCPSGLACIQGVCGGPGAIDASSSAVDSGHAGDAGVPSDAAPPDAGDGGAGASRGCAPATLTRLLCEDFADANIAPAWIQAINETGHLALVDEPSVSKPRALRADVKGYPSGDDARLFRNFTGPFAHARITFDVQLESNSGSYFVFALGDCAFYLGTNATGALGHVKNGATNEEADGNVADPELAKSGVWRRVALDVQGTTAKVSFDDVPRASIVSPTSCGTGDVSLSPGIYAQRSYAVVYIDNVSLDVE